MHVPNRPSSRVGAPRGRAAVRPLPAPSALHLAVALAAAAATLTAQRPGTRVLDERLLHLGDSRVETWEGVAADPEGTRYALTFESPAVRGEAVVFLTHRDVDNRWDVVVNGQRIAQLKRGKALIRQPYTIPAGVLRRGRNELSVEPTRSTDDIAIGRAEFFPGPLREALGLRVLSITVTDQDGAETPAKITLAKTRPDGGWDLAEPYNAERLMTAVRPGIVYTGDGRVRCELPPGTYTVWASKGPEWGVARTEVELTGDGGKSVDLQVSREVDTTGWIACDTHIHTLTYSGHGDSSVEERMVTLAAEGVELPIATDHNHNTDYLPVQRKMKLTDAFRAVTGNEVTTPVGHMNAFPLDPDEKPPEHRLEDWVRLVDGIRAAGAQVVVLNHPRWPQIPTGPFGRFGLDRATGDLPGPRGDDLPDGRDTGRQMVVPFDGMELVNTTTLQTDPTYLLVDWFALLNRGVRIGAVGSSDSHTVGDPVGQGRTYVPSRTDVPARIDLREMWRGFRELRTTVSFGIFCELEVDPDRRGSGGRTDGVGSTVELGSDGAVDLVLRVASPSWTTPERVVVYVNGREVESREIECPEDADGARLPLDETYRFTVRPSAGHDSWIVCAVFGDGVREPFWPTLKNYTYAGTNPVWIEADGIRGWSSPRATAERLVAGAMRAGAEGAPTRLAEAADGVAADETLRLQLLAAVRDELVAQGTVEVDALRAALAPFAEALGTEAGKDWVEGLKAR